MDSSPDIIDLDPEMARIIAQGDEVSSPNHPITLSPSFRG
jgi:hypothetical protein